MSPALLVLIGVIIVLALGLIIRRFFFPWPLNVRCYVYLSLEIVVVFSSERKSEWHLFLNEYFIVLDNEVGVTHTFQR